MSSFRVSLLLLVLNSVFFRVLPWQMLMFSCNLTPNLNISKILQPSEGGLVATPASVNIGVYKSNILFSNIVNYFYYRNTCFITYLNSFCINRIISDYCHLDLDFYPTPTQITRRFAYYLDFCLGNALHAFKCVPKSL